MLFNDFDDTVMLYIAFVSFAAETVEVGTSRDIVSGRIPELVSTADVGSVEDPRAPFVVDVKCVDRIGQSFDKILDDKDVVDAIAVGSDYRGESQHIVDDDDIVLNGVDALDQSTAGASVIGTCDETDGIAACQVFAFIGCPFEGGTGFSEGME